MCLSVPPPASFSRLSPRRHELPPDTCVTLWLTLNQTRYSVKCLASCSCLDAPSQHPAGRPSATAITPEGSCCPQGLPGPAQAADAASRL